MATNTLDTLNTGTDIDSAEFAASIAAKVQSHPFLSRLAATEHEDQPTTANDNADVLVDGDGRMDVDDTALAPVSADITSSHPAPSTTGADTDGIFSPSVSAPADDDLSAPAGYRLRDGEVDIELSDEQIRGMLALSQWAQQIAANEQLARQFGALEQGVAVAVPTDEYARYQAWLAGASTQQSRPAPDTDWLADLDPEQRDAISRLQAENAALQQQAVQFQQQAVQSRQPAISAETDRITAEFDTAISAYAQANGLTADQAGELLDVAVRANIIGNLTESQRQYSPSGILVRDADFSLVARQALDFGRLQRPDIASAHATTLPFGGAATPSGAAPVLPGAVTSSSAPTTDPVAMKKARSASLAAAPSAATVPPSFDSRTATPQAQRDAMAKFLRDQGIAS